MERIPPRDGYGKALLGLCARDPRVIVLDADVAKSTRTAWIRDEFPDAFIDMGVSEQDMVSTAAGLAIAGLRPFASTYSAFLAGRAYDQIRSSVCHDALNVKLAGAHAGFSVGPDGSVHQSLEDIAAMRALPNMAVIVPCDAYQVEKAVYAANEWEGPCYLRFGREPTPIITDIDTEFEIGKARPVSDGEGVAILANGLLVSEAIEAARILAERGISAAVADIHTVKPLDEGFILDAARRTGAVVTAEEHQKAGGLGSAVSELLAEGCPVPVVRVGVEDVFGESGSPEELMARYGLVAADIVRAAEKAISLKNFRGGL